VKPASRKVARTALWEASDSFRVDRRPSGRWDGRRSPACGTFRLTRDTLRTAPQEADSRVGTFSVMWITTKFYVPARGLENPLRLDCGTGYEPGTRAAGRSHAKHEYSDGLRAAVCLRSLGLQAATMRP